MHISATSSFEKKSRNYLMYLPKDEMLPMGFKLMVHVFGMIASM